MTQTQHLEERSRTLFKCFFQRQLGVNAGCHIDNYGRLGACWYRKAHRRGTGCSSDRTLRTVSKTVAGDRKPGAIRFKRES